MTAPLWIAAHPVLAASPPAKSDPLDVLLPIGVLIVAVIVLGSLVMVIRARVLGGRADEKNATFLESLRSARDAGEISREEFDAARSAFLSGMTGTGGSGGTGGPPVSSSSGGTGGRPVSRPRPPSPPPEHRAPPGFDLTGDPLPPREPQ